MNREELSLMSIHELRVLGRNLGVKNTTSKKKSILIDKILDISSGKELPCFSQLGRPPYKTNFCNKIEKRNLTDYEIKKIDEILSKAKEEILNLFKE